MRSRSCWNGQCQWKQRDVVFGADWCFVHVWLRWGLLGEWKCSQPNWTTSQIAHDWPADLVMSSWLRSCQKVSGGKHMQPVILSQSGKQTLISPVPRSKVSELNAAFSSSPHDRLLDTAERKTHNVGRHAIIYLFIFVLHNAKPGVFIVNKYPSFVVLREKKTKDVFKVRSLIFVVITFTIFSWHINSRKKRNEFTFLFHFNEFMFYLRLCHVNDILIHFLYIKTNTKPCPCFLYKIIWTSKW